MAFAVEPPVTTPRNLDEAYRLLADGPWRAIAGGTDVMVQLAADVAEPPARMLDLWRLDALRGIALDGDALVVGALTTYTELRRSGAILTRLPALAEAAATIGAVQIQNRGTLGGNIVNASPAGDTLPLLLATDAVFEVGGARGERTVPVASFWPAYRKTALAEDELLLRVRIPLPAGRRVRFRKVGTRRAQAISKVVMGLSWRADAGAWHDVRLGLGSVAATPIRAATTEAVLEGAPAGEVTADLAAAALAAELQPIDDVRSTAEYRRMVSARVLHRLLREEVSW